MSQILNPSNGGGGGGGVTSVEGTGPIEVNGVSGVPQTGAVVVSTTQSDLHVSKFIVGDVTNGANFSTIAAALTAAAASAPQTIYLQTGIYTENLTLPGNVNITSLDGVNIAVSTSNVIIRGSHTFTGGLLKCAISNLTLESGSTAAPILTIDQNVITFENVKFVNMLSTNPSILSTTGAVIGILNCVCSYVAGGFINADSSFFTIVNLFDLSAPNTQSLFSGASGNLLIENSSFNSEISIVNAVEFSANNSSLGIFGTDNGPTLVIDTTGTCEISNCVIGAGPSAAIFLTNTGELTASNCTVFSNASTGFAIDVGSTGTLNHIGLALPGTATGINPTLTQTGMILPLANPTAGLVLTSTGPNTPPTFQASGGGGGGAQFTAYLSAPTAGVTGDGTLFGPIPFDAIMTNVGGGYNASGVFTAPTTGVYAFQHTIAFNGSDPTVSGYITLWSGSVFSTRAFQLQPIAGGGTEIFSATVVIPMAAGDTMSISALASGGGAGSVTIFGGAPNSLAVTSLFSGYQIS